MKTEIREHFDGFLKDLDLQYFQYTFASCLFYLFVFNVVGPRLSEKYVPAFKGLFGAYKIDWNSRINSTINAILSSSICVYCILYDEEIARDPAWGHSWLVRTNAALVAGYMLADTIILFQYWEEIGEVFYITHHCAAIIGFFTLMSRGCLAWFGNFRLLAELSTPFVNQRWFLMSCGYGKTDPVYLLNGFAMALTFFFCRILTIPPYYSRMWALVGTEASLRLGFAWYVLIGTAVALDSINIYWMYKIFSGITKVLQMKFQEVMAKAN